MNRICRRSILFADHVAEANLTSRSAGLKINDNNKLQRLFLLCSALNIVADYQSKKASCPTICGVWFAHFQRGSKQTTLMTTLPQLSAKNSLVASSFLLQDFLFYFYFAEGERN